MQRATREPRRRCNALGFTLLELMIVVVIIGIVVIGAILSLGATGTDSALQQERDRLAALMAYTRERGAMLTLEYGIRLGQHGYRFAFYDNRLAQWSAERVDETLRLRQLPSGLRFRLQIEGKDIVLDDKALQVSPVATPPADGVLPTSNAKGLTSSATGSSSLSLANLANVPGSSSSSGGSGSSGSSRGSSTLGSSTNFGAPGSSGGGLNSTVNDDTPQLLLFSNGDTNAFVLTIERAEVGRSATLQSSDDGTIHVGDIIETKQ